MSALWLEPSCHYFNQNRIVQGNSTNKSFSVYQWEWELRRWAKLVSSQWKSSYLSLKRYLREGIKRDSLSLSLSLYVSDTVAHNRGLQFKAQLCKKSLLFITFPLCCSVEATRTRGKKDRGGIREEIMLACHSESYTLATKWPHRAWPLSWEKGRCDLKQL